MNGIEAMVGAFLVTPGEYSTTEGDLVVTLAATHRNTAVLSVRRLNGRVGEREAVDIAVDVHKRLATAGTQVDQEMLSYRGVDRSRCFLLTFDGGNPAA